MTLLARWRIGIGLRDQLPVHAFYVLLPNLGMTRCAIDFPRDRLARTNMRGIDFCMTLTACGFLVTGTELHLFPDEQRTTVFARLQFLVLVAAHTIRIGHALIVEDFSNLMRLVAINARG